MPLKNAPFSCLAAIAAIAFGLSVPAQAETVQAMSATAFLDGFGMESHLSAAPVNHGRTYYNLFHSIAAATTGAAALANLHTLLAGQFFDPSRLDFQVDNMPAFGHQLLMQKSNGTFVLALWNETRRSSVENGMTPNATVTLKLPSAASLVQVFDPAVGTRTQQTALNVTAIPIAISDRPILVFIVPQVRSL